MFLIKTIFVILSTLVLIHKVNSDRNNGHGGDVEWEAVDSTFDSNIYEEILDAEECAKQIQHLVLNDMLLMMTFLESGPRIPRGIRQGNLQDLGNYHQCLGIHEEIDDMVIDGKYCQISIILSDLLNFKSTIELEILNKAADSIKDEIYLYEKIRTDLGALNGMESNKSSRSEINIGFLSFRIAICIPKPCSIRQALPNLLSTVSVNYQELFCRFKNDKPWTPAVYVAIIIFSLIGLLAILSTSYDIWNTVIHKRDPKSLNTICQSFSIYTNSRRLVTYKPVRGTLECVDGIRAISMAWIVLGHTFGSFPPFINSLEFMQWGLSYVSIWVTASPIGVDTFFTLSGLLIVYTSVGKLSNMKLLTNLHLFYLNRFLRMFPLLATTVLLQVGVLHYIHDGPIWTRVAGPTEVCRTNWWLTLLFVQNFFLPMCIGHTWYLAIDMQLHILSPLVLFWVLSGKKNRAWSALIVVLLVSLTGSSIYNFLHNFVSTSVRPVLPPGESQRYSKYYYYNTLTRCSPFFVGMCFGYLIHFWREKNIRLTKIWICVLWIVSLGLLFLALCATEPMKSPNFDNQTVENLVNSFMRPTWAFGLGWLILACVEGYGGPINWFLSLRMWKLPSRLSYAIYLLHVPIQNVIVGAASQNIYFSVMNFMYMYWGQFVIFFAVSFVFTILVDFPCSTIFKMFLGSGIKKSDSKRETR